MKKVLFFLLAVMLSLPLTMRAQDLQDYVFSTGTDATKWITLTNPTSIVSSYYDDQAFSLCPIGFNFALGDGVYTQFSTNSNGNFRLGSTATSSSYYSTPFSITNATYNNPKIVGIGRDMGTGSNGYIEYELVGTAPDRVLVCEFAMGYTYGSSNPGDVKWQIQLHETTNNITIVYGPTDPTNTPLSFQIGMCVDASNAITIDPSTHTTSFGTSSTTYSTWPGASRYYEFEAPVITCPAIADLAASNVDESSADITWTAGASETDWDIYLTEIGTDVPDSTSVPTYTSTQNSYSFTGLTSSTNYYVYVRSNCGAGDVSKWKGLSFMTSQIPAELPYTQDFEDADENANWTLTVNGVNQWVIDTAVNTTPEGQYSLYVSNDNGVSNSYSHSTSTSWAYRDIDFGSHAEYEISFKFRGVGESTNYDYVKVYLGPPATPPASGSYSGATPAGATLLGTLALQSNWVDATAVVNSSFQGVQRLYFLWWNDAGGGNPPAGAIDDLTVIGSDCGTPYDLVADTATTESITVSFTPALESDDAWDIILVAHGDTIDETQAVSISTPSYEFTGLEATTLYDIYVRTNCGSETSFWSQVLNARTACPDYIAVPFTEFFDTYGSGSSAYPDCWGRLSNYTSTSFPYISSSSPASTPGNLYFYSTATYYSVAIAPAIDTDITPINTLSVSFKIKRTSTSSGYGAMEVGVMTDPTDISTFTPVQSYTGSEWTTTSTWYDVEVPLTNYTGGGAYIALRKPATASGYTYIDNFGVYETPSCERPSSITATSTATDTVSVSWVDGEGNLWDLIYGPSGFDPMDPPVDAVLVSGLTETNYFADGLTGGISYDFYVRRDCGGGDVSNWSMSPATGSPYLVLMGVTGSSSVTGCGFTVTDDGGLTGNYSNNCSYYLTIYPSDPDSLVSVTGTIQAESASYDYIIIYEGACNASTAATATQLYKSNQTSSSQTLTFGPFESTSGPLTLYFRSDVFGQYPGFVVNASCVAVPDCRKPINFATVGTTSSSVDFIWSEVGDATVWNVAYGPVGFTPNPSSSMEVAYDTTVTINGLTAGTSYDFYVQSDCGGSQSIWTGPITATPGTYNMPVTGTNTISMCGGIIYDDGGATGSYSNNANSYLTIYPSDPDSLVSISGTFSGEGSVDHLSVYEGTSATAANLIQNINSGSSGTVINFGPITSESGPLTLWFYSDVSVVYPGFAVNVSCVAAPTCRKAYDIQTQTVTANDITLTWNTNSENYEGFNIVASTEPTFDPDTCTMSFTSTTTSYQLTGLTSNTVYYIKIQTNCGGGDLSEWTDAYIASTSANTAMVPYYSDFSDPTDNADWVIFNGTQASQWYIGTPSGTTDTILYVSNDNGVTNGYNGASASYVWACRDIELGNFAEYALDISWKCAGESSFDYMYVYIGSPVPVTAGSGTAPAGATLLSTSYLNQQTSYTHFTTVLDGSYANTTKRIYLMWRNDGSVYNDPAASVESISLTGSNCGRPHTVQASNITTTSADISFVPASSNDFAWEYAYGPIGSSVESLTPMSISDTLIQLTDLSASTGYVIYVRTDCGSGEYSAWSDVCTFYTNCGMITVPYSQTFDNIGTGSSVHPLCWTCSNTYSTTAYPYVSSSYSHSGNASLYFYCSTSSYNLAVLPQVDVLTNPINTLQLSFWMRSTSGITSSIIVGVMTDPANASTFVPVDTFNNSVTSQFEFRECILSNYTGTGEYVALKLVNSSSTYSVYVDDVILEDIPSCPRPQNLTASSTTTTTADLTWTEMGSATTWNIEYGPVGFIQGTGTVETATANPYTVTGLTASTTYDFYVQGDCGGGDLSAWSFKGTFATQCDAVTIPYSDNFDTYGTGTTVYPQCWSKINTYTSGDRPYISPTYYYSAPGSMYFFAGTGSYNMAITPAIDVAYPVNTLQASFKYRAYNSTDRLIVGVMTNPLDATTFVPVDTVAPASTVSTWIDVEIVFNSYAGNGQYIAFKNEATTTSAYAMVDDLEIIEAPTCARPRGLIVDATSSTSVTLSWTEIGTASSWEIEYGEAGFTQGQGTTVSATTNPYTVDNLTTGTTYEFYVRAVCSASDQSPWRGPVSAQPGSYNMPVSGSNSITMCGGTIYDDGGQNGNYSINCNSTLTVNPETANERVQLTGTYDTESSWDELFIYDGASASGTLLGTYSGSGSISLTSTTGPLTLVFESDGSVVSSGFALQVTCVGDTTPPIPTCNVPTNVAASNVTYNSASINWTAGGNETAWNLQYKKANQTTWSNSIAVTSRPYTLSNLDAETAYNVRVQANCGADGTSDWSTVANFTTAAAPADPCDDPTGLTVGNITAHSAVATWTAGGDETSWNVQYKQTSASAWNSATVSTPTYTIEGLTPQTGYTIQVQAVCSATNLSNWVSTTFTTLVDGISSVELANSISIMPNPAESYIELTVNSNVNVKEAAIYNAFGQMIQKVTLTDNHARIDVSGMAAGMYFVRIANDNSMATKKFIKK